MEKAIEIKRRAQRCIQNGDLDGALNEYEKLVGTEDADPYNFVLLADLLYKKGEQGEASERYLAAVAAYEKAALYKNAIAVCKKMMRLSLSPAKVLKSLASLHALDGLSGEAALYYVQYAEYMVRANSPEEAATALRKAFDVCQDNIKVLEQLSEALLLAGEPQKSALALTEAATHYRSRGEDASARRCEKRAAQIDSGSPPTPNPSVIHADPIDDSEPAAPIEHERPSRAAPNHAAAPAPGATDFTAMSGAGVTPAASGGAHDMDGFETGRHTPPGAVEATKPSSAEIESPMGAAPGSYGTIPLGDPVVPEETEEEAQTPEGVYEIEEEPAAPEPEAPAHTAPASAAAPGLAFDQPAAAPAQTPEEDAIARVESLLGTAQEQFRAGHRELASHTLAEAAQAYEDLGRLDSAATIYRSLGRGAQASAEIMELWLANCERRNDPREAAQVACELGDRALNDGNERHARLRFERAVAFDPQNETARRRLQRLGGDVSTPPSGAFAVPAPAAANGDPASGADRVQVAVGRAEAVTFDLAGLLSEFQRGVEAQLAGDAQSHYDLGMTYREMGLLEQAVDSFRISQQDPALAARALEMIGRCHADQARWAEAVGEFRRALAQPGVGPGNDGELRYHYAQALVELGEPEAALSEYENVSRQMPGFEDVDERITALKRVMGRA